MKKIYDNFEEATGVALLAFMAILAFLNVVTRYLIHYSFAFTEEVEVAALVWLTVLGAAAGFRKGVHLGFGLLALRFPELGRRLLLPLASVLTILTLCILFGFSIGQMREEIGLGITTEALNIPQFWYTLALPVGCVLMVVRVVEASLKEMRGK